MVRLKITVSAHEGDRPSSRQLLDYWQSIALVEKYGDMLDDHW